MAPRYTTVDAVELALRTPTSSSSQSVSWSGSTFNAQLSRIVETAERLIDQHCGWSFDPPANDATATSRTVHGSRFEATVAIHTPPISAPENVKVTVTESDEEVDLEERCWDWVHYGESNLDAWRHIILDRPRYGPIKMEAIWGWPIVPSAVKDAAVQWAAHLFIQENTPLGAQAFDFGAVHVSAMPRGVMQLLRDYRDTSMEVFV